MLTNFINPLFLEARRKKASAGPPLRLVAAGNLKSVKNYDYLLEVLGELPGEIQLDIYGEGSLRAALERRIAASGLNARLLGARSDLWNVLANYDLFVMPSLYEGCPNAAIEAMAVGLPLLLSDIPVMREISQGNALFFDPNDPRSFVEMFERIRSGEVDLAAMSRKGLDLVQARYLKSGYVERLNSIYARKAKAAQVSPNEA